MFKGKDESQQIFFKTLADILKRWEEYTWPTFSCVQVCDGRDDEVWKGVTFIGIWGFSDCGAGKGSLGNQFAGVGN